MTYICGDLLDLRHLQTVRSILDLEDRDDIRELADQQEMGGSEGAGRVEGAVSGTVARWVDLDGVDEVEAVVGR